MYGVFLISAVCVQIGLSSGEPHPAGVGAYAYQDSTGNRYGGTYGLNGEQAAPGSQEYAGLPGNFPVPFGPDFDDFFPEYFRNFENLLQEAFNSNKEYQRKALDTAKKAYDITSNQAGFIPNIDFSRFSPFGAPQFHNFGMPFGNQNSAVASAMAAPGFTHQYAGLSPENPGMPNVDVTNRFAEASGPSNGFMSVSSSSFSSSSNVNGKEENHRSAETLVNNNGKVTHYKVQD